MPVLEYIRFSQTNVPYTRFFCKCAFYFFASGETIYFLRDHRRHLSLPHCINPRIIFESGLCVKVTRFEKLPLRIFEVISSITVKILLKF